jgi:hypothetical protein
MCSDSVNAALHTSHLYVPPPQCAAQQVPEQLEIREVRTLHVYRMTSQHTRARTRPVATHVTLRTRARESIVPRTAE